MGGRQTMTARTGGTCVATLPTGREIVIPPGGCTGWHFHRVRLDAVVLSGTLTRVLHDRTVEVHTAGTTFVEPAGIGHIHLGHNLGTEPVVLHVTPALPAGTPFSIPTPAPAGITPADCGHHSPRHIP
ncbi:cupin domain-containing protein [Streptomyces sp. NRRL S-241]|uniref:cupin domain-containing protein n=1 Tax=Streptomyces sp. NRRL S-241 TaxID=1463896 RepID=UPI00068AEE84|nr:cupin domain-containing protein [Streptomyces sp. NRRL S-241]